MAKKIVALFLSAAMVASMMTACGEPKGKEENSNGKETTEKGEDSGEEITLKVFDAHAYGLDQYAEMVEAFEKDHPGVKIEVQHAANDSNTLLQSRVNSGDILTYLMWNLELPQKNIMNTLMIGQKIRM